MLNAVFSVLNEKNNDFVFDTNTVDDGLSQKNTQLSLQLMKNLWNCDKNKKVQ